MSRLTEQDLIARYFAPLAGPGGLGLRDDAALLAPAPGTELVLTADALVAGVHFFSQDPPEKIAAKALAVNLSDLAAKAADPLGFLLTLALPREWTPDWLEAFSRGLGEMAAQNHCPLLGGDTVAPRAPHTLSTPAGGALAAGAMKRRTTASPGDAFYVSGTIGDAVLGLCLRKAELGQAPAPVWADSLSPEQREMLIGRYLLPRPRLALVPALRAASAAMDISDGLVGDLRALARESGVHAQVDLRQIPLSAAAEAALGADPALFDPILCGGDDYELLCAVPSDATALFEALAKTAGVPVAAVGRACPPEAAEIFLGRNGRPKFFERDRYSHF
jgi:thiamine-monophosphate kinase